MTLIKIDVSHSHGLLKHLDLLAAFRRLPLERVAVVGPRGGGVLGQRGVRTELCGGRRSVVRNEPQQTAEGRERGGAGTFVLVGAAAAAAAAHVVEDGEVGWRDGVGAAAAVAVAAAQASAGRRLRVDAAGAAAALRRHRRRSAVAVRGVLRLPEEKYSST